MTAASAQAYSDSLLQRINTASSRLFGPLPAAPSRPVLLQNLVDLWCADWSAIKLAFAAPAVQGQATAAAASAAVLSALLSGAQVAQAMARGDAAAASRAAAAATALAGTAVTHVQQLQAITAEGAQAPAEGVRGSSRGERVPTSMGAAAAAEAGAADAAGAGAGAAAAFPVPTGTPAHGSERAAAAAGVGSHRVSTGGTLPAVPLLSEAAAHGPLLPPSAPPASSSPPPPSGADTLQAAAAEAAGLAAHLQQAATPSSQTLRRGAGLLVLLGDSWGGKAKQLQAGRAVVSGQEYTHFSVLQLMTTEGLLLQDGHSQKVSVRVASDFLPAQQPRTGHWSKQQHTVIITPGRDLLLSCQPQHTWGQRFTASCSAASSSYLALYDGLSDTSISTALSEQGCQPLL